MLDFPRKGFSLLEAIFVVGLLSLILTLSFSLAVRFMRVARGEALRNEISQQLLISLGRICTSAAKTVPSGVSLSQSPPIAVAFNPYREDGNGQVVDGNGTLFWTDDFQVYAWVQNPGDLVHWTWTPSTPAELTEHSSPNRAKRLDGNFLREIVTLFRPTQLSRLASGVVNFEITPAGAESELRQPLKFTLTLERSLSGRAQPLRGTSSKTIFLAGSR